MDCRADPGQLRVCTMCMEGPRGLPPYAGQCLCGMRAMVWYVRDRHMPGRSGTSRARPPGSHVSVGGWPDKLSQLPTRPSRTEAPERGLHVHITPGFQKVYRGKITRPSQSSVGAEASPACVGNKAVSTTGRYEGFGTATVPVLHGQRGSSHRHSSTQVPSTARPEKVETSRQGESAIHHAVFGIR